MKASIAPSYIDMFRYQRHPNDGVRKVALLLIFIILFLGGSIMQLLNWRTGALSAPSFQKLYPQFYISLLLLVFMNKGHLARCKEEVRLLIFFMVLVVFTFLVGNTGGLSNLFNSLVIPVFVSLILHGMRDSFRFRTRSFVLTFFVVNCGLAIVERILQFNLFPFTGSEGDAEMVDNLFRSTALQNHPLNNALFTTIIMAFILCDDKISNLRKYLLLFLGVVSLLCYNTRSSIILWAIVLVVHLILVLFSGKKKFRAIKPWLITSFVIIGCALYYLLFVYGWGNRLIELDFNDDSSTYQRLKLLRLIEATNFSDFLLGASSAEANRLLLRFDLEHVENYWIIYIMRYGIIFTSLIFVFYFGLFKKLFLGYSKKNVLFISFIFLLLSSTNNSLAFNSQSLAVFVICCYSFSPIIFNKKNE